MLRDVLARLRCNKCGGRPTMMALVERPEPGRAGTRQDDVPHWRIELRREPLGTA